MLGTARTLLALLLALAPAALAGDPPLTGEAKTRADAIDRVLAGDSPADARPLLETARKETPHAIFDYHLAQLEAEAGNTTRAIELCEMAIERHPTFGRAWDLKGKTEIQAQAWRAATLSFENAIEHGSANADSCGMLGMAYKGIGDLEGAVNALLMASALDPKVWRFPLVLALREADRRPEAILLLNSMVTEEVEGRRLFTFRNNLLVEMGREGEALAHHAELEEKGAAVTQDRIHLAYLLAHSELVERQRRAADVIVRALELDPRTNPYNVDQVVRDLESRGHRDEAARVREAKAAAAEKIVGQNNDIVLYLDAKGGVLHQGRSIGVAGVRAAVRAELAKVARPVVLHAHRETPVEILVKVIDAAKLGGAKNVTLGTTPEGHKGR